MLNDSLEVGSSLLVYTIKKIRKRKYLCNNSFHKRLCSLPIQEEKQMREEFERQQQIDKIYQKIV